MRKYSTGKSKPLGQGANGPLPPTGEGRRHTASYSLFGNQLAAVAIGSVEEPCVRLPHRSCPPENGECAGLSFNMNLYPSPGDILESQSLRSFPIPSIVSCRIRVHVCQSHIDRRQHSLLKKLLECYGQSLCLQFGIRHLASCRRHSFVLKSGRGPF